VIVEGKADGATRLALAATCGAAVLVLLSYFPPLEAPFIAPKMAVLDVGAAVALLAFALRVRAGRAAGLWARPVVTGVALVLATTTLSWAAVAARTPGGAPYAALAFARWGALFALACGAAVVAASPARQTLLEAATGGAALVSLIGLGQHLDLLSLSIPVISAPGSTFGNRNFAGEAVAMCVPLGLAAVYGARQGAADGVAARRRAALLTGAVLVELVYLAATRARGAWLGGAAGVAVFGLLARPRLSRRGAGLVLGGALAAVAVGVLPGRINSRDVGDTKRFASGVEVAEASFDPRSPALRTRIAIWRRSLAMWRQHPFLGVGPGNWPVWLPRFAEPDARRDGVLTTTLAAHEAHDDLLERACETGLVGLAALLALAAGVVINVRRRLRAGDASERVATASAAGALAALAGAGLTGFPLEMPGTLTLAGLALGLAAASPRARTHEAGPPPSSARSRGVANLGVGLAALLVVGVAITAQRQLRGSYWLGEAVRALRRDLGPAGGRAAAPALGRARVLLPGNYRVWLRSAHAWARLGRHAESAWAARRALELEPWAANAWTTLATEQLKMGDDQGARKSSLQALAILHDHPYALAVTADSARALGLREEEKAARLRLHDLATAPPPYDDTAREARSVLRERAKAATPPAAGDQQERARQQPAQQEPARPQ
jgi:O-antigen ligase